MEKKLYVGSVKKILMKLFCHQLFVLMIATLAFTSCVNADLYEIYEDDESVLILRRKKTKSEYNQAYQWTCFIITPVYMAGGDIDRYMMELDNFLRNKRGVEETITDYNRDYYCHKIFGSAYLDGSFQSDGPKNGASIDEMKELLTKMKGYSYDFSPFDNKDDIVNFIRGIKKDGYINKKEKHKKYYDMDFAISCSTSMGGHVAAFCDRKKGDIVVEPSWADVLEYSVTGYYGVFYPTGLVD